MKRLGEYDGERRKPAGSGRRSKFEAATKTVAASNSAAPCACGGGCPRCRAAAKGQNSEIPVQAKLRIGAVDDPAEREADAIAANVVADTGAEPAQVAAAATPPPIRRRPAVGAGAVTVPPAARADAGLRSRGAPLAPAVREDMETRFGHDFSAVRVHTDADAQRSAAGIDADAYTAGNEIVFGEGRYAPQTSAGRRLLAHELTHVVQQARPGAMPTIRRQQADSDTSAGPQMSVNGDSQRASPEAGAPVRGGALRWTLRYVGRRGGTTTSGNQVQVTMPMDVRMDVSYTPAGTTTCPTITFIQIVRATVGGLPAHAHLLFLRNASGFAADVAVNQSTGNATETEPFYGAGPSASGPGLAPDMGQQLGGNAPGRSAQATLADGPSYPASQIPAGRPLAREFETAAICAETGETFGSVRWGYTKTSAGVVTLTGGTSADVQSTGASAEVESARQSYYSGFFQHSLTDFARGAHRLTPAHEATLRTVAATGNVRRIVLVGANDFSGGPESNAALSLQRAQAARDFLVNTLQVNPTLIAVEGHGVEARTPNPAGQQVAANRRVDIHLERGTLPGPGTPPPPGSAREELNLRHRDPHLIFSDLIDTIFELQRSTGTIPAERCRQLSNHVFALRRWRGLDPSVPDVAPYTAAIAELRRRCPSAIERAPFDWRLPPLQPPSFLDRIEEATRHPPF